MPNSIPSSCSRVFSSYCFAVPLDRLLKALTKTLMPPLRVNGQLHSWRWARRKCQGTVTVTSRFHYVSIGYIASSHHYRDKYRPTYTELLHPPRAIGTWILTVITNTMTLLNRALRCMVFPGTQHARNVHMPDKLLISVPGRMHLKHGHRQAHLKHRATSNRHSASVTIPLLQLALNFHRRTLEA